MTLTQMKYYEAACRFLNFTKAAEYLHVTQPAVSAAMKELEHECGVVLLKKQGNTLCLTDEGQLLFREIEKMLKYYDDLQYVVGTLHLTRNFVRVGFSTFSGNLIFPTVLKVFQTEYPDIHVTAVEDSTTKLFDMLDNDELDLIITVMSGSKAQNTEKFDKLYGHIATKETVMVYCVRRDDALAQKTSISLREVAQHPLVLMSDNFSQTRLLKKAMSAEGITPKVVHYTNQMYTIVRFVESGIAGGFLPQMVAERNPHIVGIPCEYCPTGMVEIFWRRDRHNFTAIKNFLNIVKRIYK